MSVGELERTRRISLVAACCSSASLSFFSASAVFARSSARAFRSSRTSAASWAFVVDAIVTALSQVVPTSRAAAAQGGLGGLAPRPPISQIGQELGGGAHALEEMIDPEMLVGAVL